VSDTNKPLPDLSEAVSRASVHVKERGVAAQEAAERQKPRSQAPALVGAAVIFAAVIAWDVYAFSRAPAPVPTDELRVDLRWLVADAVGVIEGFRIETGRLPTRAELGDLLAEDLLYEVRGDSYVVAVAEGALRVQFDGTVPLDRWVDDESAGPGA